MTTFDDKIYPFTTENIKGYLGKLGPKDKTILTVGSSGDQAFNSLLLGAKEVTVFDVSYYAESFINDKIEMILKYPREEFYRLITEQNKYQVCALEDQGPLNTLKNDCNYLENDEQYKKLQEILFKAKINFIRGDVYEMDSYLTDEVYDRILLSNVLDYTKKYCFLNCSFEWLIQHSFEQWNHHLSADGIIQILYLYSYEVSKSLTYEVIQALNEYMNHFYMYEVSDRENGDKTAIITYEKSK